MDIISPERPGPSPDAPPAFAAAPISDSQTLRLLCRVLSKDQPTRSKAIAELSNGSVADAVLTLAKAENVLPALYEAISGYPECLSKSGRIELAMNYEMNRRRNRQIRDAVLAIAEAVGGHSIEVVALKGARWIVEDEAGCAAWRSMIDIDLLVRVENYESVRTIVEQIGYRPMRSERDVLGRRRFAGHYHQVARRRDDQPFVTEIHRHSQWQPGLLETDAIFVQSRKVAPGLRLPAPWHAALHAIIHWQIHHYGYLFGFDRINDGLDIASFLHRDDVDWRALKEHAERVGIRADVDNALATVIELFGAPPPPGFPVTDTARTYAANALRTRDSLLLKRLAKQRQRFDRLWHDQRFIYRSHLQKSGPTRMRIGLWAMRVRRAPFLISHLASIAVLRLLAGFQQPR